MDSPSPSATPPRRLFRLGRAADPLAPLAGPPDALFAGTAIVLCSTRRGAFVEALAPPASAVGPTGLPSDVIAVALRFVDPRPLLDLRSPLDPAVLQRLAVEVSAHAGRLPLSLARELGGEGSPAAAATDPETALGARFAPLPEGGGETGVPPERLGDAFARAAAAGFAGIAYRSARASSQVCWAVSRGAALTLLAPPRAVSPHDPDLVAVGRLLDRV